MDKQVYKLLSTADQIRMAVLWESEDMKTIIRAIDAFQTLQAKITIANSPNHETTVLNRGQNIGARFIADLAETSYKAKKTAKEA